MFVCSNFAPLVVDGRKFLSYYKYTQDLMSSRAARCALAERARRRRRRRAAGGCRRIALALALSNDDGVELEQDVGRRQLHFTTFQLHSQDTRSSIQ